MTSNEFDVACMGFVFGAGFGAWAGYTMRRVVGNVRAPREAKPATAPLAVHARRPLAHEPAFVALPKYERAPVAAPYREPAPDPNRAEVIAVLVGAGFKKATATMAADACTPDEKASGVEQWTVAALKHAMAAK